MTTTHNTKFNRPFWYLLSKKEYSTKKFDELIDNGYWEYHEDKVKRDWERKLYRRYLHNMKIADKVAIYNLYRQTRDDFEQVHNYQLKQTTVTYILIRAIGKITQPCKDNKTIYFDCQKVSDSRRWYHHTYPGQIWKVMPQSDYPWRKNLTDFTFDGAEQDLVELKDALTK